MLRDRHGEPVTRLGIPLILSGFLLGACVQTPRPPLTDADLPPRDRALLANAPYARVTLPVAYQRTVVQFHRKEAPGSIVIDTDARYLYYVLADNKAVRYGVAVGEEALSWYGIVRIARKEEWPSWTPTAEIKRRLGNIPDFVEGGRTILWALVPFISIRVVRILCSAFMGPISRKISVGLYRPGAFA